MKLRSVRSIVMAPASTGRDSSRSTAVINTAQTNSGIRCIVTPIGRMFTIVVIKLIAPKIELAPARCRLKIARSTDGPPCANTLASGGYTVQPVPAPDSTIADDRSMMSAGGSNQKLMLFSRGNAMSGAPSIIGTNQLPKPPIIIGITKKKIMTKACPVIRTFQSCPLPIRIPFPGSASSIRITKLMVVPTTAEKVPKIM